MKNYEIAKWLRIVLMFVGVVGFMICVFVIPSLAKETAVSNPEYAHYKTPVMVFIYITALPFFLGIFEALKICKYLLTGDSFLYKIVNSFIYISRYAFLEAIFYALGGIILFILNLLHPGILILLSIIILAATTIAIFTGLLSQFIKNTIDIKCENDLTI